MKKYLLASVLAVAILLAAGFPGMRMSAAAGNVLEDVEENTTAQLLDEFSRYLDYLYGQTFNGYLGDYEKKESETGVSPGYDRSEVPTTNMGYYISDFDQDGQEELLVVGISNEYKLQFSMYEVTDGNKIYESDTYTLKSSLGEKAAEQFAFEERDGSTVIYAYEFNGPRLLALCSGCSMLATGHITLYIPVKYDGSRFVQDIEPFGYNKSAGLQDEDFESLRSKFEAIGTGSLSVDECKELTSSQPITKYLEKPQEIARVSTKAVDDYLNQYEEWRKGSQKERFKAATIHFSAKEDLKSFD